MLQTYYYNAFYRELREETERPKLQKRFVSLERGLAEVTDREWTNIQWAISEPERKGKRILKRPFPLALSRGIEFLQEFARSSPDAKRIQVKGVKAIPFL